MSSFAGSVGLTSSGTPFLSISSIVGRASTSTKCVPGTIVPSSRATAPSTLNAPPVTWLSPFMAL